MALRPGSLLEMSSHFIPLPRRSMMTASSSGDHLLCFLAGDSVGCGAMVRFPGAPRLGPDPGPGRGAAYKGGPKGAAAVVVATVRGADGGREFWGGDTEDSFESGALRREAISTMPVCRLDSLEQARCHGAVLAQETAQAKG
jgi:hypothetical protein